MYLVLGVNDSLLMDNDDLEKCYWMDAKLGNFIVYAW